MVKKIALLIGGWSDERVISLASGREVARVLQQQGHDVNIIDIERHNLNLFQQLAYKPDVVFLCAIHGKGVEDGCLQGALEMMKLPYTNSGPLASALAMNKHLSRTLFKAAGIPIAEGGLYNRHDIDQRHVMPPPYVIKPVSEGSSLGVKLIRHDQDLQNLDEVWRYGHDVIVERFIPGREIQVLVMGDKAIGTVEVRANDSFCDYEAKYVAGMSERLCPAPLEPEAHAQALDIALRAHQALGCEGVSRVDLRYDDTQGVPGAFFVLEVNTQPGMTPTSFAPLVAAQAGIEFTDLIEWMVDNPRCPQ